MVMLWHTRRSKKLNKDNGNVIVEIAFAIPALVLILLVLFWLVALGLGHSRAVDLAQQAARSLARGIDPAVVDQTIDKVLPGATLSTSQSGELIDATITHKVFAPIPLLSGMSFTVQASSTAVVEPASVGSPFGELP